MFMLQTSITLNQLINLFPKDIWNYPVGKWFSHSKKSFSLFPKDVMIEKDENKKKHGVLPNTYIHPAKFWVAVLTEDISDHVPSSKLQKEFVLK